MKTFTIADYPRKALGHERMFMDLAKALKAFRDAGANEGRA